MALSDAVSCLLCLDAFERPTMLRIHLRPIGGGDPREYYLCQRCGGAIAAEYLYIQNSGKAEPAIKVDDHDPPSGETWDDGSAHDHEPGIMQPPIEAATADVGEVQTVEATKVQPKGKHKT
jgi:hypothetical protein